MVHLKVNFDVAQQQYVNNSGVYKKRKVKLNPILHAGIEKNIVQKEAVLKYVVVEQHEICPFIQFQNPLTPFWGQGIVGAIQ